MIKKFIDKRDEKYLKRSVIQNQIIVRGENTNS